MSFLFVDRILALETGRYIQGIKHVTLSDQYLHYNQQGKLALMPSIIGETLGQLAAWNIMYANHFTTRPVAGIVSAVNIYDDALVGDSILLETYLDDCNDDAIQYHSVAKVRGKTIFEIENALGPLLPMEDFIEKQVVQQQFANIYRPGTVHINDGPRLDSFDGTIPIKQIATFDTIIDLKPRQYAVAEKMVSLAAPYFSDHFPHKPVLPLTILLNCKLHLAQQFIQQSFDGEERDFKIKHIRRIKMNEFVKPGDILTTKLELKQHTKSEIILSFRSEVANKKVCVAEAVFSNVRNEHGSSE